MIVTISREYGAAGRAVSRGLAQRLGYRLLDDDLPVVVAAQLGTSPDTVESVEHRRRGLAERLLRSLTAAVPELVHPAHENVDVDDDVVREIERAIQAAAQAGEVVIVGRIGSKILGPRPDAVRVFLYAPLEWRVEHIVASLDMSPEAARAEIHRVDEGRHAFARERYDIELGDPREYDLLVDVARFGVAGSIEVIAAAVTAGR